jgi:hypothetical protein
MTAPTGRAATTGSERAMMLLVCVLALLGLAGMVAVAG